MNLLARAVGDIAIELPGAVAILRDRRIDFCCAGALSLSEAAQRSGVDVDALAKELEAAAPLPPPTKLPADALIALILERYHAVHRHEFPQLIELARKVEAVHCSHSACPNGLTDFLLDTFADLEGHMRKEESVLFPLLLAEGGSCVPFAMKRMRAEHEDHGARLKLMALLTDDFTPPANACRTWRALYAGCAKLDGDLREHIHLENNVLFPCFENASA